MREVTKVVGLVALMVGARYAPLERTGEVLAWLGKTKAPAGPALVTGSVTKSPEGLLADQAALEAKSGARGKSLDDTVRTILAQATSEVPRPNQRQNAGGGDGGRARVKHDDAVSDEMFTGGTGLLDDGDAGEDKTHPMASAHPDDFIVICEAGCRPSSDRIVYQVSKLAAASGALAPRRLQPTAAEPAPAEAAEAGKPADPAAPADSNAESINDVVCVAGCYDEPVPAKRHAGQPDAGKKLAQAAAQSHSEARTAAASEERGKDSAPAVQDTPVPENAASSATDLQSASNVRDEESVAHTVLDHAAATADVAQPALVQPAPLRAEEAAASQVAIVSEDNLPAVHSISAETQAYLAAKRAKLAVAPASGWRTKVSSSVVALRKPAAPSRSVVAMQTASPFATSVSVESGWEWNLVNTQ